MNYMDDITELERLYVELTKDGRIGGSHPLKKISEICLSICLNAGRGKILPSFVLYTIFSDIAFDQDDRLVTTEECKELYDLLNDSIYIIIGHLKNPPADKILLQDIEKLIQNYNKLVKK